MFGIYLELALRTICRMFVPVHPSSAPRVSPYRWHDYKPQDVEEEEREIRIVRDRRVDTFRLRNASLKPALRRATRASTLLLSVPHLTTPLAWSGVKMTTQFDKIYHGLSPEVGSEWPEQFARLEQSTDPGPDRNSVRCQWNGMERRRPRRRDGWDRKRGYQMGAMAEGGSELPTTSGAEGQVAGDFRWFHSRGAW